MRATAAQQAPSRAPCAESSARLCRCAPASLHACRSALFCPQPTPASARRPKAAHRSHANLPPALQSSSSTFLQHTKQQRNARPRAAAAAKPSTSRPTTQPLTARPHATYDDDEHTGDQGPAGAPRTDVRPDDAALSSGSSSSAQRQQQRQTRRWMDAGGCSRTPTSSSSSSGDDEAPPRGRALSRGVVRLCQPGKTRAGACRTREAGFQEPQGPCGREEPVLATMPCVVEARREGVQGC